MKLNMDCIRDVLIVLEENLDLSDNLGFESLNFEELVTFENLSKYSRKEIYYSIYNLREIGFIDATTKDADDGVYYCSIENITYDGHEFLRSIISDSVWEKVKQALKKSEAYTIPLIMEAAKRIIMSTF